MKPTIKQRLTVFIYPEIIKRAKVRAALEGLTLSEVVEKALGVYAPSIEQTADQNIQLTFSRTHRTIK